MSRAFVACLVAAALAAAPPSRAAAPDAAAQATLDRSVRFLQDAQNLDGGFGGRIGQPSDPGFSAWAAYALAAAGINPQDQAKPGGVDVHTYLTSNTAGLSQTTDFDRVALVALASGTSPSDFGGVDAIGTILSRQLPDGSLPQIAGSSDGWINSTIWSIFPLSAVAGDEAAAAVQRAADWLLTQQRPDGSWPSFSPASWSDADMTGAAIQALVAAGRQGTEAEELAFEYLRGAQREDGGFEATPGGGSNSATTAWVIQGMWAAGQDPRSWRTASGNEPLSYLASLQRPDGSIGWTTDDDLNSLWMTAQVGPALAGHYYPLASVPRQVKAPPRPAEQAPASTQVPRASRRGQGGFQVVRGKGVIAGGGGRGAPLFSAPQPQSGGATPRGSRQVEATASTAQPAPATTPPPSAPESNAGEAGVAGARGKGRGTGAGGGTVEGLLVSGDGSLAPAAPGLAGASSGGEPQRGILIALLGSLLAAAAIGSRRERAGVRPA